MKNIYWDEVAAISAVGIFALLIAYLLLLFTPRMIYAERVCLQNGYQDAAVDWALSAYCLRYDEYGRTTLLPLTEVKRD